MLLQDIIGDDEIKLDWFFKASLIHDLVNVSVCRLSHLLFCSLISTSIYYGSFYIKSSFRLSCIMKYAFFVLIFLPQQPLFEEVI